MDKWFQALWAQDTGAGGAGTAQADSTQDADTQGAEQTKQAEKTFTQAELDKILEERLARDRRATDKLIQEKVQAAKTEAEKLAKMSADEKMAHEKQQKEEALAKREADITARELRSLALEMLAEKDLPKELIEAVKMTDADTCSASITALEKAYRSAVQKGVNDRMKGTPPKEAGAQRDISKTTATERMRLKAENPEHYEKLFGGK